MSPPLRDWSQILFIERRPQMKPVSYSHSCIPVCSLTQLYTCPNSTTSECYLFSSGHCKAFATHWRVHTKLSLARIHCVQCVQCKSHAIFYHSLTHQTFNPCINPTSLMDMPIPIITFHSMYLITET